MGFDAGDVMRELDGQRVMREVDAQRLLRESSHLISVKDALRHNQKMLREISGVDQMLRSFGGMDQVVRDANSSRSLALSAARSFSGIVNPAGANTASIHANLAKRIVPESLRRGLPGYVGNLSGLSHQAQMQSDALRHGRMFGILGLSSSIAQAFKMQGLASAYSEGWRLRVIPYTRTSALQSNLRATSTFGPIVVFFRTGGQER